MSLSSAESATSGNAKPKPVDEKSLPVDDLEIALDLNEAEAEAQEADERLAQEKGLGDLSADDGVSEIVSLKQLLTGAKFGGYRIIKEIGHGAMSRVFAAEQLSMERIVALKCLHPDLAGTRFAKQFQSEARLAGRLTHQNIVQVYDVGFERGVHYIAMEYVRGRNLQRILSQTRMFTAALATQVVKTIGEGLRFAYQNGLVHRDIKLDNVMITADKVVKLMDFGLVQDVTTKAEEEEAHIAGSPNYISPEQARGEKTDFHTDVYSLGVCFYYMVTGRFPFLGVTTDHLVRAHIEKTAKPPRDINPHLPETVSDMVLRMMSKKADDRAESWDKLINELEGLVRSAQRGEIGLAPGIVHRRALLKTEDPTAVSAALGVESPPERTFENANQDRSLTGPHPGLKPPDIVHGAGVPMAKVRPAPPPLSAPPPAAGSAATVAAPPMLVDAPPAAKKGEGEFVAPPPAVHVPGKGAIVAAPPAVAEAAKDDIPVPPLVEPAEVNPPPTAGKPAPPSVKPGTGKVGTGKVGTVGPQGVKPAPAADKPRPKPGGPPPGARPAAPGQPGAGSRPQGAPGAPVKPGSNGPAKPTGAAAAASAPADAVDAGDGDTASRTKKTLGPIRSRRRRR